MKLVITNIPGSTRTFGCELHSYNNHMGPQSLTFNNDSCLEGDPFIARRYDFDSRSVCFIEIVAVQCIMNATDYM